MSMKDGAIVCNSGHFNDEIDLESLARISTEREHPRTFVERYTLKNGKKVSILADGRLVNLAAGEGHPAAVMDMSFANQALAAAHLAKNYKSLEKKVYPVPEAIDEEVASLKLASMNVRIDTLTPEQAKYLASWSEGTRKWRIADCSPANP